MSISRVLTLLAVLGVMVASCVDDPDASSALAPVIQETSMSLNGAEVQLSCKVSKSDNIKECGFYFGLSEGDMKRYDSALPEGNEFTFNMKDLTYGVRYYYRAFISGGEDSRMSGVERMEIDQQRPFPSIVSLTVDGKNSVVCEYSVADNFSGEMFICGLCWSTSPLPTIDSKTKTLDGSEYGGRTVTVDGLEIGETYYFRVYAVNGKGTAYSEEKVLVVPVPFEDKTLSEWMAANWDTDSDGVISGPEAMRVTKIDILSDDVASLGGIEYLPNLDTLRCRGLSYGVGGGSGRLTEVDLGRLSNLSCLDLSNNKIGAIDLSSLVRLRYLSVAGNALIKPDLFTPDLPFLAGLKALDVSGCQQLSPDFSLFPALEELHYDEDSEIKNSTESVFRNSRGLRRLYTGGSLRDEDKIYLLPKLETLDCAGSQVRNLNLRYNLGLRTLNVDGCGRMTDLDLGANTGVSALRCMNNGINRLYLAEGKKIDGINVNLDEHRYIPERTRILYYPRIEDEDFKRFLLDSYDIDNDSFVSFSETEDVEVVAISDSDYPSVSSLYGIEMFKSLKVLKVSGLSMLTDLDVSKNSTLEELQCDAVPVKSLDLKGCPAIKTIYAQKAGLESLTVPYSLEEAYLSSSDKLKELDLSSGENLRKLVCDGCPLETLDIRHCLSMEYLDCSSVSLKTLYVGKGQLEGMRLVKDSRTQVVEL